MLRSKVLSRLRPWRSYSAASEKPRINQVGIQYMSEGLHRKLFPMTLPDDYLSPQQPRLLQISREHLRANELLGKKTLLSKPIDIENFPPLVGAKSVDEHFHRIAAHASEPYLSMAKNFLKIGLELPPSPKPHEWLFAEGWTRYAPGCEPVQVAYPLENELCFDIEVLYKRSPYSVMATCASKDAWYGWVSPFLVNHSRDPTYDDYEHLIPFNTLKTPKLILGYNVSFDRAAVKDEYNITQSKAFYLDGMAMHVAVSGICSQQRIKWLSHSKSKRTLEETIAADEEEHSPLENLHTNDDAAQTTDSMSQEIAEALMEDPWLDKGAPNSLANVYEFHCGRQLDKSDRDYFGQPDPKVVIDNFGSLMSYCARDVMATFDVMQKLWPEFRRKIPHPVSFAALRHMGTLMLPTSQKWERYINDAETVYQKNRQQVANNLQEKVESLVAHIQDPERPQPNHENDPWLSQLDWAIKKPRYRKDGSLTKNQAYLTGYPEWYRDLFKTTAKEGTKQRIMNMTLRTRIAPIILRLKFEGYPLLWTNSAGWCFKVPFGTEAVSAMELKNYTKANLSEEDHVKFAPQLCDGGNAYELFKVPHPDGPSKRCTTVLLKLYMRFFEEGVLSSEYDIAQTFLALNSQASYWVGNRKRIMGQFVVYADLLGKKVQFFNDVGESERNSEMGIIIPRLCSMGTITRRATENTWLTAANANRKRIGLELKSLVEAPPGYCFVGADVDSEELWIALLVGDSLFKIHGGTSLGWMTLEGDKNEKTDLHSKTAEILGILRGDAKVFNYGRVYGAGVKFAARLLKQFNASLSEDQASKTAELLYARTKGQKNKDPSINRLIYHGGTELIMFNALEAIAFQPDPRTPVLGAAITDALSVKYLNKNSYLPLRINWAIQSSGVDYLHLLLVSMEHLMERFGVEGRVIITVHDELRYMVKEKDKYVAALLLQISNAWTRAMFSEQLGIKELPQLCAFFSEVDFDHVLRKEVGIDCVTPSNPHAIAPGESLDILGILARCDNGNVLKGRPGWDGQNSEETEIMMQKFMDIPYATRKPILANMEEGLCKEAQVARIQLQTSLNKKEWRHNYAAYNRAREKACDSFKVGGERGIKTSKPNDSDNNSKALPPLKENEPQTSTGTKRLPRRSRKVPAEFDIVNDGSAELEKETQLYLKDGNLGGAKTGDGGGKDNNKNKGRTNPNEERPEIKGSRVIMIRSKNMAASQAEDMNSELSIGTSQNSIDPRSLESMNLAISKVVPLLKIGVDVEKNALVPPRDLYEDHGAQTALNPSILEQHMSNLDGRGPKPEQVQIPIHNNPPFEKPQKQWGRTRLKHRNHLSE